jgi:hypothetical protein
VQGKMARSLPLALLILAGFFCRSYLFSLFNHPYGAHHQSHTIPSDFPNDVPVYPNNQVDDARKIAGAYELELTAKSDAQTVLTFYQQQLAAYGWQVSTTSNEESDDGDGFGVSGTKDGRGVAVLVTPIKGGESAVRELVR